MSHKHPVNPTAILDATASFVVLSPKFGNTGTMRLQHLAVLVLLTQITSQARPIDARDFAARYHQNASIISKIFKHLFEAGLLQRVVVHATHHRGRAYFYYANNSTLEAALARHAMS